MQLEALAQAAQPTFMGDVSGFTSERMLETHAGACGAPPEVEILSGGQEGVFAAKGTMRLPAPAYEIFQRLTDPVENPRIFSRTCAAVNYRTMIEENRTAGTRLFEVSKTGRWHLFGFPFSFESTVFALEDWRSLEIRFRLKKPGFMKHMSGFWRMVPIGPQEALVLFYNEAVPSLPVPRVMRNFAGRAVQEMTAALMEELREASTTWASQPWEQAA